jgi:hypothetical protein
LAGAIVRALPIVDGLTAPRRLAESNLRVSSRQRKPFRKLVLERDYSLRLDWIDRAYGKVDAFAKIVRANALLPSPSPTVFVSRR